jgi:hypothetical protein
MAQWIVIAALDVVVLLGFRRLGGFAAAGDAFRDWGCAAGDIGGKNRDCA